MTGMLLSAVGRLIEPNGLPDVDADLEELLDTIKNERRRHVIDIVAGLEVEGIDLASLSERVASRQVGKPIQELTSQERKRVYIALQQHHIENIEDVGLLETGPRGSVFYPTSETQAAAELIRHLEQSTGGVA